MPADPKMVIGDLVLTQVHLMEQIAQRDAALALEKAKVAKLEADVLALKGGDRPDTPVPTTNEA
jgi:hypothetical protein